MNMNINQLIERLKDVPDASLIGYLKDPNLQVPSALALAEISRRKQIRAAAAPQVQPQAPQATVADQMMAADQGVASLPVPDTMYNEQAMAAGGIVAFDEGGDVSTDELLRASLGSPIELLGGRSIGEVLLIAHPNLSGLAEYSSRGGNSSPALQGGGRGAMQGGNLNLNNASGVGEARVPNTNNTQVQYQPHVTAFLNNPSARSGYAEGGEVEHFVKGGLSQDDIAYHRALANVNYDPTETIRRGFAYTKDILTAPGQLSWMRDPKTGKLVRAYEVEGFMPRSTGFSAAEEAKKQSRLAQLDLAEADNITRANLSGKPVTVGTTREGINQLVSDATAPQSAFMDRMVDIPVADKNVKSLGDTRTRKEKAIVDTAAGADKGGPTRNARGDLVFNRISVDDAGYDALIPKEQSMRDYAAEFKSELGEDAGRIAMKDRLAKMQAMGEKESERAPWMALAEAGLGMAAGRSQFALQNIAEGGIRGIKSFAEARDNLRRAEERRFDLESRVAQAERAEQVAAINYGAESKRTDDQNRRAVGLAKQADKARAAEFNAKGEYDAVKDKLTFQLEEAKLKQLSQYYNKTPAEIQMVRQYAQSKGIPFAQAFEAVMGMKHPGSGGLDEDTLARAYVKDRADGNLEPGMTYTQYKAQFAGCLLYTSDAADE